MARVLIKSLLLMDESSGGGSTITQQLAKNLYPRKNIPLIGMLVNKLREMIIAVRLEKVYSKEDILTLYLNTVPFGDNTYGIESASHHFFSKSPAEIKIEEACLLVGMLKATSFYNPRTHPERSLARRDVAINQMVRNQHISQEEADSLKDIPMKLKIEPVSHNEGVATYFRELLRGELDEFLANHPKEDGTYYNLYTDGLKIYTTISHTMQVYAEKAVNKQMNYLQNRFDQHWKGRDPFGKNSPVVMKAIRNSDRYKKLKKRKFDEQEIEKAFNTPVETVICTFEGEKKVTMSPLDSILHHLRFLHAGFLAMEAKTGYIRAWVGGINHKFFQYDHVISRRQAGSTFKPLVYATAIEKGVDPCTFYPNDSIVYEKYNNWTPRNADGKFGGYYSVKGALANSVNTVSVQLLMDAGVENTIELAREMGVNGNLPEVPSLALGAADISLYELVRAYSAFVNGGRLVTPVYLLRIEDNEGKVIAEFKKKISEKRVISERTAEITRKMLQGVVNNGTATSLRWRYGLYNDIAGKTGTTQSHADGWFIGFTPDIIAGAWVGGEYPQVRFRTLSLGSGSATALPIWGNFMYNLYRDPLYKYSKNSMFPASSSMVAIDMDCPDYREEEESIFDLLFKKREQDYRKPDEKAFKLIKKIRELFGNKDEDN
jgi:penicillin-binding protein 1A